LITYEDSLPIAWVPGPASEHETLALDTTNEYVLEAVAAIEEHAQDHLSEDQPELHQELKRLDAKVHLVMDMLSRLLQASADAPKARRVRVGVDRVEFRPAADEPKLEGEGTLELYLHSSIPEPLRLPGEIAMSFEDDSGRQWCVLEVAPLQRSLRDLLSRHVFRHHRRSIAAARQSGGRANNG
jgi:hypothetical protein